MSALDWEDLDRREVSGVLFDFEPSPARAGWHGLVEANGKFSTPPEPRNSASDPTCYVTWRVAYLTAATAFMDDTVEPIREGTIELAVWVETESGRGHVTDLHKQLRGLFNTADTDRLTYSPETAFSRSMGNRGEWWVEIMGIPFTGA